MDFAYQFFIFIHLVGLALGGAPAFGHLVVGAISARNPAAGPFAMAAGRGLGLVGKIGFLALVISGLAMLWLGWSLDTLTWAFWVKMGLVLMLVVNIGMASAQGAKAERGDTAAPSRLEAHAKIGAGLMIMLILFAVLAFR